MRFSIRTVQLSARDAETGFVTYQPDFYGTSSGDATGGPSFASLYPYGFRARPLDPSVGADGRTLACSALVGDDDDEGFLLPTEDPRYQAQIRDEGDGGSTLWAVRDDGTTVHVSQVRLLGKNVDGAAEGSLKIEIPYADNAKTHVIEVDLTAGKIRIAHGEGSSIEIEDSDITIAGSPDKAASVRISASAPGGDVILNAPNGKVTVTASTSVGLTAPNVDLGATGGSPPVVENGALAAAFASLASALASAGISWTPPSGYTATKVKVV